MVREGGRGPAVLRCHESTTSGAVDLDDSDEGTIAAPAFDSAVGDRIIIVPLPVDHPTAQLSLYGPVQRVVSSKHVAVYGARW
jgi:hypothetical protein